MSDCPIPLGFGRKPAYTVKGDPSTGWVPTGSSTSSEAEETTNIRTFTLDELSILCNDIGLSPEMIEGVIAQLLVQHFSAADDIIYPELKHLVWTDAADSRIAIKPLNMWNEVASSKLPAILYVDMGQNPQRIAIGDQYYQYRPDAEGFARAVTGAHRLMCVGENDYQASLLATETIRWLTEFAPQIVRKLPFHDFQVVDRAPPQAFNALGGRIGVAFTVSYSYIWAWELTPSGPPLKSLTLSVT